MAQTNVSSNAIQPLQIADWNRKGLLGGYTQHSALTATLSPFPYLQRPCLVNTGAVGSIFYLPGCTMTKVLTFAFAWRQHL